MTTARTSRTRLLIAPAVYTLFVALLFWRLWSPSGGGKTWKYDPQHEYWGDIEFQRQGLADGSMGLWNPYDRGGFPVHGDPQPGLLYPGNWPLVAMATALGDTPYPLVELKIIAHWLFAALGMHWFLRRRRSPEVACYLGGLLMCVTCPALRTTGSALNWSWAWFPWILIALDHFGRRPSYGSGVLLGSALAMPLLAGAPAVGWYALLFIAPFALATLWPHRHEWKALAPKLGIGALACLCWLAPLLLANAEIVPHTDRAATDLSFFADRGLEPGQLLNLVVPALAGGEPILIGTLALLMWGALVISKRGSADDNRALSRAGLVSAILGLLLAMGDHTPVMPVLSSVLPPIRLFRFAYRYSYIAMAAAAAGAGLGLGYVLKTDLGQRARRVLIRAGLVVAALMAVGWIAAAVWAPSSAKLGRASESLAIACVSTLVATGALHMALLGSGRARRNWAAVGVAALIGAVWIANFHHQDVGFGPRPTIERDAALGRLDGVTDFRYRIFDADYFTYRPGTRLRVRDFRGYEEDPLRMVRYRKFVATARRSPALLGHANVRYYLEAGGPKVRVPKRGMKRVERGIYELREVAPAVFWVAAPKPVVDLDDALRTLGRLHPGLGATIEDGHSPDRSPPVSEPMDEAVAGRFTEFSPNRIVAEITTPGPGLVVVSEAWFPNWKATVDGRPTPIGIANAMFRGVWVTSAGKHQIAMEFAAPRFLLSLIAFALALTTSALCIWFAIRRRS